MRIAQLESRSRGARTDGTRIAARWRGPWLIAVGMIAMWMAVPSIAHAERTRLPQDHEYQRVLREYLATFDAADFQVPIEAVQFKAEWFDSDDALYRTWLLASGGKEGQFPPTQGLRVAGEHFTLNSIESEDAIHLRAGYRGGLRVSGPGVRVQPHAMLWWATWDMPGNPYYDSQAIRNRAFVTAAVDMIMLDHLHESGDHWVKNARRSDFLGGSLIWMGYIYLHTRDELPTKVRDAYETGLGKFVRRLNEWGPTGVNDNMDMKTNVGLAYILQAVNDAQIKQMARDYVRRNVGNLVHPAGMIRDAGGLEGSYNGIALKYLVWAALVSNWPELTDIIDRMSELKAHLTLPEPDGSTYLAPSHYNMRTSADPANDQHSPEWRDLGAAMLSDHALYLAWGGRTNRAAGWALPKREAMLKQIAATDRWSALRWLNQREIGAGRVDKRLMDWEASWWGAGLPVSYNHYRDGFRQRLQKAAANDSPLLKPPFGRDQTFVRIFPDPARDDVSPRDRDTFLTARYDDYGVIIDASRLTHSGGNKALKGWSGGALSAFWTPKAGAVVLGRGEKGGSSQWSEWRRWPTHAISGETPDGDVFTSARLRRNVADVAMRVENERATVLVQGPLGADHDGSRTAQNECITGDVRYTRRFEVGPDGLAVQSTIRANGRNRVAALCESIPLFLREARYQDEKQVGHQVRFRVDGAWREAGATFVAGVEAVEVERFDGTTRIAFARPRRVRLSAEPWVDTYQTQARCRNLQIDMLELPKGQDAASLRAHRVRYRIRAQ